MDTLIRALIDSDPNRSDQAHTELVRLGYRAVETLLNALAGASDRGKWMILKTFTSIGDSRATPGAVQCLQSDNAAVVAAAAECLVAIGGDEAVDALLNLIESDSSSASMMWVIQAFGSLKNPRVVPSLIRIVETTSSSVDRYTAIDSLAKIGDPRAIATIQAHQYDGDRHVRSKANMALQILESLPCK